MESAIGKLKSEVLGQELPADHQMAQQQLFAGIECWYNQRPPSQRVGLSISRCL
jgi:hypothetical protein